MVGEPSGLVAQAGLECESSCLCFLGSWDHGPALLGLTQLGFASALMILSQF